MDDHDHDHDNDHDHDHDSDHDDLTASLEGLSALLTLRRDLE